MVAVIMKETGDLLDVDGVVEWRRVTNLALVRRHFALKALDQVTDGHTRGDGVRVDDDVGSDAFRRERHVFLAVADAARSLLTVSTRKLVADLWNLHRSNANLAELVTLLVDRDHDLRE